jgi:hypothetical protein
MPKAKINTSDATIGDVLVVVNSFATQVEKRFQQVDLKFEQLEEKIDKTRIELVAENTETRKELSREINRLEWKIVTKDYLDEKLHDLKGDLIVIMRKEDRKIDTVVDLLEKKKIFSPADTAKVLKTSIFPRPTI